MTLRELEGHYGPEFSDQLASKEKDLKNMLSDIKFRSDNIRRRRILNSMGGGNQIKDKARILPTRGVPSFMNGKDSQSDLEQILKLRVDSNVVKDFFV